MAATITATDVSETWVKAMEYLTDHGDTTNLVAVIANPDPAAERLGVRTVLDTYLMSHGYDYKVQTVANTIFPSALYPAHAPDARERLFANAADAWQVHKRRKKPEHYFHRLVAYEHPDGNVVNQLDGIIRVLRRRTIDKPTPWRRVNEMEAALTVPGLDCATFHAAGGTITQGFPCLVHVSFTLQHNRLSATALYRSQNFIGRAYGNYLGLARLLDFVAAETEATPGELMVVATAATAELKGRGNKQKKTDVEGLIARARAAIEATT